MQEKILVINDEDEIRELISLFLTQSGYETSEAVDGPQGLEKSVKERPDLILLDVLMPGMDGYQVCEKLKQDPATKDIPVIFLSSLSDPRDKIKGLEVGGVDFITRAGDRGELIARVRTHLKLSALSRELKDRNQLLMQKQKHLDEDLEAAAAIQRSLLPEPKMRFQSLDLAWECSPCDQIGGDIFNAIPIDDRHTVFYIIDVSGHGVPAAMVSVSVSQQLHTLANDFKRNLSQEVVTPQKVLQGLDKEFPLERFNKFFSIFYLVHDSVENSICYSNGGHPPAVLFNAKNPIRALNKGGTVIGVNEGIPFEQETVKLEPNDKIVMYTDGVVEFENAKHEFFGTSRLYKILDEMKSNSIKSIIEAINASLAQYGQGVKQQDDISILGIEARKEVRNGVLK